MVKKLMMLCVATMAAMGAWAAFQCEVQVHAGDIGVSRTATVTYFNDGIPQPQRLKRLNEIAIHQMRVLSQVDNRNLLK